ncbi:Hsp20/alpha crystallin family protein [Vallitalea okinawensis]|uniref:Hsp20/alpha crystallin family protein n=1 Tax=Vallitalea okinawensis TaxID=2078660 RepID=UPI00130060DE|nr:Hsp20/alpha crystallin family protein [Vallitalea okinawensis]
MFDISPYRRGRHCNWHNVDELFYDDFFRMDEKFLPPFYGSHKLKADIRETEDAFEVEIDVPGMTKDDITLRYEQKTLIIEGKRDFKKDIKEENYIRRERSYGSFVRAFYFDHVNEEAISASFQDGVLLVQLPKLPSTKPSKRHINID